MKEKIYFIPGLMTDIRLWKRLTPLLNDTYDIVHTPIPHSTNFDEIVHILDKHFDNEQINLLGFSLGGYISSYFSCKFPNRVKRLFTVSATPGTTSKEEIARRELKIEAFKNSDDFGIDIKKALSLVEEANQNDEDLLKTIVEMFNDLGRETFITQLYSTFNRVDLFEELKKLNIPIYMFYSNNDRLLDQISLKRIEKEEHNIKMLKREGTSHNIPLEYACDLANHIRDWMKE